ncbi:hypothetical protein BZA77DRAFT_243917, partial [Pyronema omphalodes]
RVEGTGNWFLLQPEFPKWGDSQSCHTGSVLAYSGIPDAGTSVMCSLVCDYLCTQFLSEETACVICLYCDHRDCKNQTPVNMIGVLLKQVIISLSRAGLLPSDIISTLRRHLNEQKDIDRGEASRLFGETVKQLRKLYVSINALDECNEPSLRVDTITSGDFKRM